MSYKKQSKETNQSIYITFIFMHLADAFIQSDLQCIQVIIFFCQYMSSLGIEPTTFALLAQCSTTEPQEHNTNNKKQTKKQVKTKLKTNQKTKHKQINTVS